ncbi:MAG: hypothetical protein ACOCUW_04300, partial [Gemmatimonadota bacterium]
PLDPAMDQLRYERLIRRVLEAAAPELTRRAREAGPLALVAGWARPALTVAAVITALAIGVLSAVDRSASAAAGSVADALGVPAPASEWIEDGREPTAADLVVAMEQR